MVSEAFLKSMNRTRTLKPLSIALFQVLGPVRMGWASSLRWDVPQLHKFVRFNIPENNPLDGISAGAYDLEYHIHACRGGSRHSPDSHGRMSDFMAEKLSIINSRLHNICNVYFLI